MFKVGLLVMLFAFALPASAENVVGTVQYEILSRRVVAVDTLTSEIVVVAHHPVKEVVSFSGAVRDAWYEGKNIHLILEREFNEGEVFPFTVIFEEKQNWVLERAIPFLFGVAIIIILGLLLDRHQHGSRNRV